MSVAINFSARPIDKRRPKLRFLRFAFIGCANFEAEKLFSVCQWELGQ